MGRAVKIGCALRRRATHTSVVAAAESVVLRVGLPEPASGVLLLMAGARAPAPLAKTERCCGPGVSAAARGLGAGTGLPSAAPVFTAQLLSAGRSLNDLSARQGALGGERLLAGLLLAWALRGLGSRVDSGGGRCLDLSSWAPAARGSVPGRTPSRRSSCLHPPSQAQPAHPARETLRAARAG